MQSIAALFKEIEIQNQDMTSSPTPANEVKAGEKLYCRADVWQTNMDGSLQYGNWDARPDGACGENHKSLSIESKYFSKKTVYSKCPNGFDLYVVTRL